MKAPHGYLLDMDGVLYRGSEPIREALNFLKRLQHQRIPYLLVTNHSCITCEGYSRKLRRMGIRVPPERIYSSSEATAQWLAMKGIHSVFAIGEEGLLAALRTRGIRWNDGKARHVVVGLDRKLTYKHLKTACRMISSGAKFIGTNPDPSYPVEDGLAPECGAILGAVKGATGCEPLIIGKPSPVIFQLAAKRLGMPIQRLTMIGDRLDTDILGARNSGAKSILVLTGHTRKSMLKETRIRPDRVLKSLAGL